MVLVSGLAQGEHVHNRGWLFHFELPFIAVSITAFFLMVCRCQELKREWICIRIRRNQLITYVSNSLR